MDAKIKDINKEQSSFTVGHNKFSTWTDDEYMRLMGDNAGNDLILRRYAEELDASNLEDSVDWRTRGAVNAVQNQG
jgi:hypothetical protein